MSAPAGALDLRPLPERERPDAVLAAFELLSEGESRLVLSDADLRPAFDRLRRAREPLLLWLPIRSGEGDHRAEMFRLRPKDLEPGLCDYFGRDHDEIDALLTYLRQDAGSVPEAALRDRFEELDLRLERHILAEEEILFPALERKLPAPAAAVGAALRAEHEDIRLLKSRARAQLAAGSPHAAPALEALARFLAGHNRTEEASCYPLAERFLSSAETADLLARVRSARASLREPRDPAPPSGV